MKALHVIVVAVTLTTANIAVGSLAQEGTPTSEQGAQKAPASSSPNTVHPQHETGTTGWRGGNRASDTTTAGADSTPSDPAAADQPEMATGVDLNGPPKRFPPSQTPE